MTYRSICTLSSKYENPNVAQKSFSKRFSTYMNLRDILKRFINCFFKGYAKDETDRIRADKCKNDRKKRKLNS